MRVKDDDVPPKLDVESHAWWWKQTGARELRQVLYWRWDPIGVADSFPVTEFEYDAYLGGVLGLLKRDAGAEEIATYLHSVERERITLQTSEGTRMAVATLLVDWYPESLARWQEGPSAPM